MIFLTKSYDNFILNLLKAERNLIIKAKEPKKPSVDDFLPRGGDES